MRERERERRFDLTEYVFLSIYSSLYSVDFGESFNLFELTIKMTSSNDFLLNRFKLNCHSLLLVCSEVLLLLYFALLMFHSLLILLAYLHY